MTKDELIAKWEKKRNEYIEKGDKVVFSIVAHNYYVAKITEVDDFLKDLKQIEESEEE